MSNDRCGSAIAPSMQRRILRATRDRAAAFLRGKQVLVVDDEPFALDRLVTVLRRLGGPTLEIATAGCFDEALDACTAHRGRFHIVLVNYMLWPGAATGIDLLAALRRSGLFPEAQAVLFSMSMDRRLRRRALAAGFDDTLLTEDIEAGEIAALLERLAEAAAGANGDRDGD